MTIMMSELIIVDSRCATVICVVLDNEPPLLLIFAVSRASTIAFSDSASRALVASSRSSIFGLFSRVLAMAILCFWPPDSWQPFPPTSVSYPPGDIFTN
uniref:Uncharacterized protein n=1 Tax=Kalanchoe fedtschenkoi TaxID=63787 RepID=A0A7N0UNH1_KALFE